VAYEFELLVAQEVENIVLAAGKKVIHAQHFVTFAQQPTAQAGADESGAAGNQDSFAAHSTATLPIQLISCAWSP
jgi:hypothetical protein